MSAAPNVKDPQTWGAAEKARFFKALVDAWLLAGPSISLEEALFRPAVEEKERQILEARKVLKHVAPRVIWKRTIRSYQANFGPNTVRVEVTNDLRIRVVNPRTGETVEAPAEGPRAP